MDAKKITKYIIAVCALVGTLVGAYEAFIKDVEEIKAEPVEVELPVVDSVAVLTVTVDTNETK